LYNHGLASPYYYRARYYHPQLSRFISEDPIGFGGGDINLYSYVFNQPTGLRDPSGMVVDPISWTAAAIMCGGGATVGVSYMVLSGRKPTIENLAAGAAAGCGAGMIALVSWIAAAGAGAVAIASDLGGVVGVGGTAAAVGPPALSLAQQLALKEAQAGAGQRILQGSIRDPQFPEAVWAKMEHVHRTPIGVSITDKGVAAWSSGKTITIHYWQNLETGARTGFKFTSR
jgi:RHS repeat-associated protein